MGGGGCHGDRSKARGSGWGGRSFSSYWLCGRAAFSRRTCAEALRRGRCEAEALGFRPGLLGDRAGAGGSWRLPAPPGEGSGATRRPRAARGRARHAGARDAVAIVARGCSGCAARSQRQVLMSRARVSAWAGRAGASSRRCSPPEGGRGGGCGAGPAPTARVVRSPTLQPPGRGGDCRRGPCVPPRGLVNTWHRWHNCG